MPASPIRKLVPLADAARARGVEVYPLNIGQPDLETPPEFLAAARTFPDPCVSYAHSKGTRAALDAFASYYRSRGIALDPAEIMITTGGSEAIQFALLATTAPGDEVVVFEPFYTNYAGYAVMTGVRLVPVATRAQDGFRLPPAGAVREAIGARTRAIIVCSPNNPTGAVYDRTSLGALLDLARERGLFVISDEVYREFAYEGQPTSILDFPGHEERAILVDSVSKRYSACGARIGCIASRNPEVLDAALRFGQARLSSPSIEQHAVAALASLPQSYFDGVVAEYRGRRDALVAGVRRIPSARCEVPAGAFYLMATLPVGDAEAFAAWMLTDFQHGGRTVMLAPGPGFYATPGLGKEEVRIAYVLRAPDLERAMDVLREGVLAWRARGGG